MKINPSEINSLFETVFNKDYEDNSDEIEFSQRDKVWLSKVKETTKLLDDNHYEIGLPLKDSNFKFPKNKSQVYSHFCSALKRFNSDPSYFGECKDFMNMMLDKGYMEKVPLSELNDEISKCLYITHHGVYHKQKGKPRIVFNCSLKFGGVSLNDVLLQGPNLTSTLVGVLSRFREGLCAFAGDIQKMFYQVKVPKEDRNLLRFFWLDDQNKVSEFRICVHVFGATSSPSIATTSYCQR